MIEIKLYIDVHNSKERLFAKFIYNADINKAIRSIKGATWSQSKKQWHFDVKKEVVNLMSEKIKRIAVLNINQLKKQLQKRKQVLSVRAGSSTNNKISSLPLSTKTITSFNISNYNLQQFRTYR